MAADRVGEHPDYRPITGVRSRVVTWGLRALAIIVGLNLLAVLLAIMLNPRVDGPAGSSVVTTDDGVGAWRETLERLGADVSQLRVHPGGAGRPVEPRSRLVIIDPDPAFVDDAYRRAVREHLAAGGTVITTASDLLRLELDAGGATAAFGDADAGVERVRGQVADVASLLVTANEILDAAEPLLVTDGGRVLVAHHEGIIILADLALVSNAFFGAEDNAVLAVRLAGADPVVFDEYVHGFGLGQGLSGVPAALVSVALAVLAAAIWLWGLGSRFGPPQQADRALPPPRAAYLDGMAASMSRTTATDAGYGVLRRAAAARLDRYGERFPGRSPDERRRLAAGAFGLADADVAGLNRPIGSAEDAIAAAAVAAKIEQARSSE